jgi:hypothetical protein
VQPRQAVEQLQSNDPSLTGLDLGGNSSYEMKCAFYTEEVGRALSKNTHLTSLSLSSLTINDSNVVHIANALKENRTLTFLDLSNNKFGTEGLVSISDALKNNTTLIELNVIGQNKDFGENGLTHVMEMLEHNITLKKIVWRLHSRQSFRINNQITRNNEIERRLKESMSIDDILPESRRGQPLPSTLTKLQGSGGSHTTHTTTTTTKKDEPKTTTTTTKKDEPKITTTTTKKDEPKTTTTTTKKDEPKTTTTTTKKDEPKTTTTTTKKDEPKTTTTTTKKDEPKTTTTTTKKEEPKKPEPKKEEPKKEEPKKPEPKKEEPKKEEPKKEPKKEEPKVSGSRYDPDRLTWWVENLTNGAQITVNIEEPKQKVYISNIVDSFVIVTGKCTKISVEKAKSSGVVFDDVISIVEVVNSQKIQLQANGVVPAIQIDSTHGGTIFVQTDQGLDVKIVTSLCTGLNMCIPGVKEEDDAIESPIPEQFETKYDTKVKKWHCYPTSHSGV